MNPAISIIVPVYNVELYLKDCINSILHQAFTNWELILVNDGSTDKSGDICDGFAKEDLRIKVIHQKHCGVSAARNIGVQNAIGEYIGFVDSDDRIDLLMYQNLYQLCNEKNSDIAICQLGREINGKLINEVDVEFIKEMGNEEAMKELFKGNLYRFSLCNKLFNKKCFDNIQFPEGRIHEDLSTTYRLVAKANKVVFTNYIGYIYVKRENSILTKNYNEKRLEAFLGWEEILSFTSQKYPETFEVVISGFAFWIVDNIFYILNQVNNYKTQEKYLRRIQNHLNNYFGEIVKNDLLPFKYKALISLTYYNYHLLLVLTSLKGFIRK